MPLADQISAVLDRPDYQSLFVDKPTEDVVNQRLRANEVAATVTNIRKHPEGGFLIDYRGGDGTIGSLRHPGWNTAK